MVRAAHPRAGEVLPNRKVRVGWAAAVAALVASTAAVVLTLPTTSMSAPLDCSANTDPTLPNPPICQHGFVTRSGTQLMLDGNPFTFVGINIYNANNRDSCWYPLNNNSLLTTAFDVLPSGSVVRAWFFQPQATTNDVRDWSAFDTTLQLAADRNIRVIPVLANQWEACDGPNGTGGDKKLDTWFTDGYRTTVHLGGTVDYRSWAAEVAARYSADPTILAWQLMNEAEIIHRSSAGVETCPAGAATILRDFAADVSALVKSVDPNHLVSLGTIGTGQCGASNSEYSDVHDVPTIDLCEYHDYGSPTAPMPGDQFNGLAVRIAQCNALDKPVFIGETGIDPRETGQTLEGRAAAFVAKRDAQFSAGVVGLVAWALDTDWSTLDDYDINPRDPLLAALMGATPPPPNRTLHVSAEGDNDSVVTLRPGGAGCSGDCIAQPDVNATVTITAEARGGSEFLDWGGDDAGFCVGLSCTFTMDVDRSVTANFGPPVGDTTPPTATITAPVDGATYPLLTTASANYTCDDNVGVASCVGAVVAGQPLPASTPGPTQFTVSATDTSGLDASAVATYTVSNTLADGLGLVGSFTSIPGSVSVTDAPNPNGVTVTVPAGGSVPTVMRICDGFGAELDPGTTATLTCGSVIASVAAGRLKVTTPNGAASMTVPSGGAASLTADGVPQNLGSEPIVFVGPMTRIAVTPGVAIVGTGAAQVFTVEAFDAYDQTLGDRTSTATFTITPSATCTANSCRATTTGIRIVTAAVGTLSTTAVLDVRSAQTITFPALTAKKMTQSPVALAATATSGLAVSFVSTTPAVCTTTGANGASAVLIGPGTCSVTSLQMGDGTWASAKNVARSFNVSKATQAITFATLPARTIDQSPIMVGATSSSGLDVTFTTTTPAVCAATGPNGSAIELLDAGTCTVRAAQAGNNLYAAATSVNRNFTVSKLANVVTFGSITKRTLGESPVTVTATASSGLAVTFTSTTPAVCATGGADGSSITLVTAGTCTIRAGQAGDAVYRAATPVNRSFTVARVAQTITFATLSNRTRAQSPVIVTATASSGLPVLFSTTTPLVCTSGGPDGSVITLLAAGTCTIRANQTGDNYWNVASSVTRSFRVT